MMSVPSLMNVVEKLNDGSSVCSSLPSSTGPAMAMSLALIRPTGAAESSAVRAVEREPSTTTEAIDASGADCADAVAAGVSEGVSWDQAGVKARQSAEASKVRVKTGTAGRLVILVLSLMVVVVASRPHRHGAGRAEPV
jgi:hypothetical protein